MRYIISLRMLSQLVRCASVGIFVIVGNTAASQTYSFNFEGANGLSGWVQNDGQPIATGAGASGSTALSISVDQVNWDRRVYHPIPFDPTKVYRYSAWTKVGQV